MDLNKLKQQQAKLINHMIDIGYHPLTVDRVKFILRKLFEHEGSFESYEDFYKKFISDDGLNGKATHRQHLRYATHVIQAFDEYDKLPNKLRCNELQQWIKRSYDPLNDIFKEIVDIHVAKGLRKGRKLEVLKYERNNCSRFFLEMQKLGANTLEDISSQMILSFFNDNGKFIRGAAYKQKVCSVLNSSKGTTHYKEICRIIDDMPHLRNERHLFDILTDEEAEKIKGFLYNNSEDVNCCLRDRAIISIAYHTGMRGSDIAGLTVDNIDWDNDKIYLHQSKTGNALSLPLRPIVGNAILDYLTSEGRKDIATRNIFLNEMCHINDLRKESVSDIAHRFYKKLGIRQDKQQNGIRLFRRYLATKLLSKGVVPRYISSIMGHVDNRSLNPYIDADIEHLREMALDVSQFPIRKEVFEL